MNSFNFNLPVNLYFGRGEFQKAGGIAKQCGHKFLIVTGISSSKKSGLLSRLCNLLEENGVLYEIYDKVPQNPLTTTAEDGAKYLQETGCDAVFGLGGGSVMDAAKAIAFLAVNKGNISDYIFGKKTSSRALPIVLAPTTAGTGSEGNCFAVLTNPVTRDKKSLKAPAIFPKASIVDPELMTTMPKSVIASTCFDALCHNIEAFIAQRGTPISSMMAAEGIKLLSANMEKVYDDPNDLDAWNDVAFASTLGGMVICQAGVGAPHALEHPVSGLYEIPHGQGLAAIFPMVMDETYAYAWQKFEDLARLLGASKVQDVGDRLRGLLENIHMNNTLSNFGVKEADIDWLSENSRKIMKANLENNPKRLTLHDVNQLYRKCI